MIPIAPGSALLQLASLAPTPRAILIATLILGLAGAATSLARRASASTRHAMWLAALCASLVAAVVSTAGPIIEIQAPPVVNGPAVVPFDNEFLASLQREPLAGPSLSSALQTEAGPSLHSGRQSFIRQHAAAITIGLWLLGAIVILARAVLGRIAIARLVDRSYSVERALEPAIERAAHLAGARGDFFVRISADVDTPFTVGARKAIVFLPSDAPTWDAERLGIVLVHELAHVARFDYVSQLIATTACAVYWFNPIVWLAAARLRAEAEQAADDRVLAAGIDGVTYASHLLELARPNGAGHASAAVAVSMARSNRLERRFHAMLDSTRRRGTVPLRLQIAGGAAVMLAAVPLAGFRMIPAVMQSLSSTEVVAPARLSPVIVAPALRREAKPVVTIPATRLASRQAADTVIEKTISASAGDRISIDLPTGGEIIILPWDQPQARMRATLSGDQARQTEVVFERTSGRIDLRTSLDRSIRNSRNSNRIELWVPRRIDVNIHSAGGAIRLKGLEGTFTGETGGGEIIIEDLKGEARLSTGGGQLMVTGSDLNGSVSTGGGEAIVSAVTGNVRVSSGSGPVIRSGNSGRYVGVGGNDVTVGAGQNATVVGDRVYRGDFSMSRAGGDINLGSVPNGGTITTGGGKIDIGSSAGQLSVTTGGGDIEIGQMGGDVRATTGAGNVQITVVNTDGTTHSVEVHSGSGRVTIELPANIDARFDLETAYTERHAATTIQSDFTVSTAETTEWDSRNGSPRKYVRATGSAGSGRGLIKIRTVNGDVVIRRR